MAYPPWQINNEYWMIQMLELQRLQNGIFSSDSTIVPTAIDKFGRSRGSLPFTVFDSKQLGDARGFFWVESATGSGTGSTYSINDSSTTLSVSNATTGKIIRQTRQRHNYQPGKSQRIILTGTPGADADGVTKEWGAFDDKNGLFFRKTGDGMYVVKRSYTTGAAVDTPIAQADWNIDPMDGSGPSKLTLDFSTATIFVIDFEWLGVGDAWFGVFSGGALYYLHVFKHANALTGVYMTTPNLPIRYSIANDGTGAAATLKHICTTVQSEGGQESTGILRYASTNGTHVDADAADTTYMVVALRLKSTHIDNIVKVININMFSETNDNFEWLLVYNPTIAGTPTWTDLTNSPIQYTTGATANTVTGGTVLEGGWSSSSAAVTKVVPSLVSIGSDVAGTTDVVALCVRPLSVQADIQGSIQWIELA